MRKLASIQQISNILPIEGADKIQLASVLGWQCVIKKDEFKIGDKAIYFEIDSFLPMDERFEFLRKGCYKNHPLIGEGFRIKTIRLRGMLSQGLLMPLDFFPQISGASVGDDVTDLLHIKKWELPEIEGTQGTDYASLGIVGERPFGIPKTDETRIQSILEILEKMKGRPYYITTKLDGTSCTIYCNNGTVGVCGRRYEYACTPSSIMWEYVYKSNLLEKLKSYNRNIALQGEFCGPKIQGNKLQLPQCDFFLFDVFDIDRQCWLDFDDLVHLSDALSLNMVPIEQTGANFDLSLDALFQLSDGLYSSGRRKEGIVVRTQKNMFDPSLGSRLSFKVINNHFLLELE